MNRSISIRSRREPPSGRHRFSMSSLRGHQLPQSSRKLNKLVKSENAAIDAHETAAKERVLIASQLSDWGESTEDDAVSDISDKMGVLMAEIGEQEDLFALNLEDYRGLLKQIRNTETSVQPSRDLKAKVADELQRLKYKEAGSPRLVTMEQELVRVEAQNLVAEAQLTNVTRTKFKQAFDIHLAAIIERAEKQIILARHGRRLLNCLDDTPIIPGDPRQPYELTGETRQILEDAENDLRSWEKSFEPVQTGAAELSSTLLATARNNVQPYTEGSAAAADVESEGVSSEPARGPEGSPSRPARERTHAAHSQSNVVETRVEEEFSESATSDDRAG